MSEVLMWEEAFMWWGIACVAGLVVGTILLTMRAQ